MTQIQEVQKPVPAELLEACDREPALPAPLDDHAAADVVAEAILAGRDCRDRLDQLTRWLTPETKP